MMGEGKTILSGGAKRRLPVAVMKVMEATTMAVAVIAAGEINR
jgi:hypothetical protein